MDKEKYIVAYLKTLLDLGFVISVAHVAKAEKLYQIADDENYCAEYYPE